MIDEVVLKVEGSKAEVLGRTSMQQQNLMERGHLQEWLLAHPSVLGTGVEIIASEFDKFQTAAGDALHERLDLLAIDPDGRLVVVELKRDEATRTVHTQALTYAAMVSRLSPQDIADLWARRPGHEEMDPEAALADLQVQKLMTAGSIKSPRIVLVAAGFHATVTATAVWLNEQGVDISLIRYRLYQNRRSPRVVLAALPGALS